MLINQGFAKMLMIFTKMPCLLYGDDIAKHDCGFLGYDYDDFTTCENRCLIVPVALSVVSSKVSV